MVRTTNEIDRDVSGIPLCSWIDEATWLVRTFATDSVWNLKTTATISWDVNIDSSSVDTSGLIGKPSGTNADFVTTYASGTTITLSWLPSYVSSITNQDIVAIVQIATDWSVTNTYTRDDATMTVATNVITVVWATFVATDTFVVYTNIDRKDAYDSVLDSNKEVVQNPEWAHYTSITHPVDITNSAVNTYFKLITAEWYRSMWLQFVGTTSWTNITFKIYETFDDTATETATWWTPTATVRTDASSDILWATTITLNGTSDTFHIDTPRMPHAYMVSYAVDNATNAVDVFVRKN